MGHLIHGLGIGDENSWAFRLGRNGTSWTPPPYNIHTYLLGVYRPLQASPLEYIALVNFSLVTLQVSFDESVINQ